MDLREQSHELAMRLKEPGAPIRMLIDSMLTRQKLEKALKILRGNPDITLEKYHEMIEVDD